MKSWEDLKAGDLMKSPVVSVDVDCPLGEAARVMAENRISGLLVVDQSGAPSGVVSLSDIIACLAGLEGAASEPGGFYRQAVPKFGDEDDPGELGDEPEEPLLDRAVGEIMAPEIISVDSEDSIPEVARVLRERRIHRVFVRRGGEPIGVLSTMDVLGVLAELPLARNGA